MAINFNQTPNFYNYSGGYFANPVVFGGTSAETFETITVETRKNSEISFQTVVSLNQTVVGGEVFFDISQVLKNLLENDLPIFSNNSTSSLNSTLRFRLFELQSNQSFVVNAKSNDLENNDFSEFVFKEAVEDIIYFPANRVLKVFRNFPYFYSFYVSFSQSNYRLDFLDKNNSLLSSVSNPFESLTANLTLEHINISKILDEQAQKEEVVFIELYYLNRLAIRLDVFDINCNENQNTTLAWFNELGALETFVFRSFTQTQQEVIEKLEFRPSFSRINEDIRKVYQAKNIISPKLYAQDYENIKSIFYSNQVYIIEDSNFYPIQISNDPPLVNQKDKVIDVRIEYKTQIPNS